MEHEFYRQIVDDASDAIVVADASGTITYWNTGAEALFGHTSGEAVGQSLDLIIPERFRARHWAGYRQVMATGVTSYGDRLLAVPATRKDGQRISIEFSIALLKDEHGEVLGDRLPADRELLAERGRRPVSVDQQQVEHPAPGRVADRRPQLVVDVAGECGGHG